MRPENAPVEAYPQRSIKKYLLYIVVGLLVAFMVFNASSKDYKGAARNYLTEQGREDKIDSVISKTSSELKQEAEDQRNTWDQMQVDYARMKLELEYIKTHVLTENQRQELAGIESVAEKVANV